MTFRASRVAATTLALALILSGCSVTQLPTGSGTSTKPGTTGTTGTTGGTGTTGTTGTSVTTDGTVHNLPLEPLNGIEFKPITAGTSKFIANNGGIVAAGGGNIVAAGGGNIVAAGGGNAVSTNASGAVAMAPSAKSAAAPSAAIASDARGESTGLGIVSNGGGGLVANTPPQDTASGGGAYSGNVWSYYGYNGYFGGYGDQQMALVSMQQAELPGNKGGFADVIGTTAAPIVKAWAADARLVSSSAMVGNDGALLPADANNGGGGPMMGKMIAVDSAIYGGYGDPTGWSLTYASTRRTEVLSFTVTPAKTTVVRMRWEPLNLDPARVSADSTSAVKKIIAAVKDKGFKGAEETSGKDYFLGFPFDQPKTGQWDGDYQRTEVVYDVPANARWNVSLQEIMGKLVWQMNYYAPYEGVTTNVGVATPASEPMIVAAGAGNDTAKPAPCTPKFQEQSGWFNNSAQGMVDAETGTVIRFSRPTRSFYKQQINDCAVPPTETVAPAVGILTK
ncbi:MAG: hypothetical protein JWM80_5102 [Cyanobacteria bacterium RYN_339]|nr:hypothetical protein [Cyanobacteria bacterium RYN_339]